MSLSNLYDETNTVLRGDLNAGLSVYTRRAVGPGVKLLRPQCRTVDTHMENSRNRDTANDNRELVGVNDDMAAKLKRLRRENEILRQKREIWMRATAFSPRSFRFIDQKKKKFPATRLLHTGVNQSGCFLEGTTGQPPPA